MPQAPADGPQIRAAWMAAANKKAEDAEIQRIQGVLEARYKEDPRNKKHTELFFEPVGNTGESRFDTFARKFRSELAAWQAVLGQVEWFANQSEEYKIQMYGPKQKGGARKYRRKATRRRKTRRRH